MSLPQWLTQAPNLRKLATECLAPAQAGVFLAHTTMPELTSVDRDLANQVVAVIADDDWPKVREHFIDKILDEMPTAIMQRLTGTRDDYDQAEKFLLEYYEPTERNKTLILDAFQILGTTQTCYMLDLILPKGEHELPGV